MGEAGCGPLLAWLGPQLRAPGWQAGPGRGLHPPPRPRPRPRLGVPASDRMVGLRLGRAAALRRAGTASRDVGEEPGVLLRSLGAPPGVGRPGSGGEGGAG